MEILILTIALVVFCYFHALSYKNPDDIPFNLYLCGVAFLAIWGCAEIEWYYLFLIPGISIGGFISAIYIKENSENNESITAPVIGLIVCICILISCFSSINSENEDSNTNLSQYSAYRVTIDRKLVEYAGVGREFQYTEYVNDQYITPSTIIPASSTLTCYAKVVEKDSYRYPDIGDGSVTINTFQTNKCHVFVRVNEYGGQSNKGAYAIFSITFTFTGYSYK
jgi:hypothetical protein